MERHDWLRHRNCGLHVTIRDVDCRDFDVPRFVADLQSLHVTFFSMFVGGYVTTYPTRLRYQRMSPYLNGRDLAGEIVQAAHGAGIKVLAMIDLGQIPENAARDHPEWCAQDEAGHLMERMPGLYASCPMGGYQTDYVREIVAEILQRYDMDCIKFGGGSFGFSRSICYCPACVAAFREATRQELPRQPEWNDPLWRSYVAWRLDAARNRVHALGDVVRSIDPDMPFMGNSVGFGDPGWTVGAAIDVEHQAVVADAVQVEVQTRARWDDAAGRAAWQYLSWPAETARFMTSISARPIWVVGSYFLAWPWRRSAMAPVEQKVYMAQVAANGADPMINLSGGPPAVHEDPRGFAPVRELYGFLSDNRAYYEGDTSGATVAIVYSQDTMFFYGQDDPEDRYVAAIRGFEQALHAAHVPFDIISTRVLEEWDLNRYKVLILPSLACLSDGEAAALRRFSAQGGGIVATFESSLYDSRGNKRTDFLLADLLGAHYLGRTRAAAASDQTGYKQVYMTIAQRHPILDGFEGTSLLPLGGDICEIDASGSTTVPLTLSAPFVVFPEGFSYPTSPASELPMAVLTDNSSGGRTAYFPSQIDRLFWHVRYPDHGALLASAVKWAAKTPMPVEIKGPSTLQVSLRLQPGRRLVHLINLTGGERFFRELIPLHDIAVAIPHGGAVSGIRARSLATGQELPLDRNGTHWRVTVPVLKDYDVIVFEAN